MLKFLAFVPDSHVKLPGGQTFRTPSGYLAVDRHRPRGFVILVQPTTSWSAPGITYARGPASTTADNVTPSPDPGSC